LLWWWRSARPKNVNLKVTYCEGCQVCLNETDLEIVVGEGVEAGH
jgi:Pyruvate/2-oxoacid:ferredoxin oxidoreductase delta subunit